MGVAPPVGCGVALVVGIAVESVLVGIGNPIGIVVEAGKGTGVPDPLPEPLHRKRSLQMTTGVTGGGGVNSILPTVGIATDVPIESAATDVNARAPSRTE